MDDLEPTDDGVSLEDAAPRGSSVRATIGAWLKARERHISAAAFILGFVLDTLFIPIIDHITTPSILGGYLTLVAFFIIGLQLVESKDVKGRWAQSMAHIFPHAIQFIFGGLMSVLFVYYSRSATIVGSLPFMLFFGAMFVGNEIFRSRFMRLPFQLVTFFFTLFLGMTVCIPIFMHTLGLVPFLVSGVVSMSMTGVLMVLLYVLRPHAMKERLMTVSGFMIAIFVFTSVLYGTHFIPPIPLVLRDAGVFHSVTKNASGDYVSVGEPLAWKESVGLLTPTIHILAGEQVYFFSAVYAPIAIRTPLVHEWQYKDPKSTDWVPSMKVTFPIVGGRDGGYRAYSLKQAITPGTWRVLVKTEDGKLVGRETFVVAENVGVPPRLQTTIF